MEGTVLKSLKGGGDRGGASQQEPTGPPEVSLGRRAAPCLQWMGLCLQWMGPAHLLPTPVTTPPGPAFSVHLSTEAAGDTPARTFPRSGR